MRNIIPAFLFLFFIEPAYSQSKDKDYLSSKSLNDMTVNYGSKSWNKKSSELDSAYLYLRDGNSKRLAKIILEESEPDSAIFEGKFRVRWEDLPIVKPEIFVPKDLKASQNVNPFEKLIGTQAVTRKPFIYKKDDKQKQLLEVFDTTEQAESALKNYKENVETKKKSKAITTEKVLDAAQEAAAREAKRQAELIALQAAADQRENYRLRQEQLEKQRQAEMLKEQQRLSAEEQRKRKLQARQHAKAAIQKYQAGEYEAAEEFFKKATELAPDNHEYYFQYGVTLYRIEKFNESIVKLNLAKVTKAEEIEKAYYQALIHYHLKELKQAEEKFNFVSSANHPVLSPAATFYHGILLFGTEEFETAKKKFETVLDTSQDAAMDQKAEEYIEKCIQMIAYQKDLKKRHIVSLTFGAMYDSNVTYQSDSTSSTSTDTASARFIGGYGYEYRLTKKETSELSLKSNGNMMYSADDTLSIADPYVLNGFVSYALKGNWGKKVYKLTFDPGYEVIHLNSDGTGPVEANSGTYQLKNTLMLVEGSTVALYNLDFYSEDSLSEVTSDDDDADAMRINLKTMQMFFQDKAMKTAIIAGGGLTYNEAVGDNKDYTKLDLMLMYTAPMASWLSSWNAGLTGYYQNYANVAEARTDTNYAVNAGVGKTWNEQTNSSLSLNYTLNNSNEEANTYNKYSITLSTTHNF